MSEPSTNGHDVDWIRSILPHRYPFLLVDRVLDIEAGKRVVALKNVTANEQFFLGHFPQRPVMPGVLIIEALAQAAGILLLHDREDRGSYLVYLTAVERARFRRPVVPGDQLRLEVELAQLRRDYSKVRTRALVAGEVVAEAVLSSAMVKR
ncbi:MAG: 3-hydroxyacyl-ACP dehydratase FabZ [Acidobacteriota bacterium]|nr:3-hydroxyacyl-ACP dehydratase FabZ [Acidobacteriota bacterium]